MISEDVPLSAGWTKAASPSTRLLFRACLIGGLIFAACCVGCRGRQHAHVLRDDERDMVGSHTAGAETWKPLVVESVSRLLDRHSREVIPVSGSAFDRPRRQICFVGVENLSSEELGDFKYQIQEQIDTIISQSGVYSPVSRRYVEAGLRETRLQPDELFIPGKRQMFAGALERMNQPFDFLLFARITSGTTGSNGDYQRDYLLTLEMVDVHTGTAEKESASLRKGYHKSVLGRLRHYDDDD